MLLTTRLTKLRYKKNNHEIHFRKARIGICFCRHRYNSDRYVRRAKEEATGECRRRRRRYNTEG